MIFLPKKLPLVNLNPKFKFSYGFEASNVLNTLGCCPGALTEIIDSPHQPLDV